MKKQFRYCSLLPVNIVIILTIILVSFGGSRAVTVLSATAPVQIQRAVVIDAGHGGVDGGATSCTGMLESQYNLEIALKLRDLLNLLGIHTVMIRETDCSVYTEGKTIAQKKVSDLKKRVEIINSTDNAILLSIHQNHFTQQQYSGAQVFYAPTDGSQAMAYEMQKQFVEYLNPGSKRKIKKADGIYLMQHINCPGVLIECGFLSNPHESYLLGESDYQRKLCSIIACTVSSTVFCS